MKKPSITTADHHYAGHRIDIRAEQRSSRRWQGYWDVATLGERGKVEETEPTAQEAEDAALVDARYFIKRRLEAAENGFSGSDGKQAR